MITNSHRSAALAVAPLLTVAPSRRITSANLHAHLTWDCGTPEEEHRDGTARGFEVALEIGDRGVLLHLCEGLDGGPAEFTRRLQLARVEVDPEMPLADYARLEFGGHGGGIHGSYASGFRRAFEHLRALLQLH